MNTLDVERTLQRIRTAYEASKPTLESSVATQEARRTRCARQDGLKRIGVPSRYADMLTGGTGQIRPSEAISAVTDFMQTDDWLLVLSSGVGTGKTLAACMWLDHILADVGFGGPNTGRWYWPSGRLGSISWRGSDLYDVISCKAMVIDDIDLYARRGEREKGRIFDILDHRYSECLRTLITTNLILKDLVNALDDPRLIDRFREKRSVAQWYGTSMRNDSEKERKKK